MKVFFSFVIAVMIGLIIISGPFLAVVYTAKKECETEESPSCPQIMCGDQNAKSLPCGQSGDQSSCYASRKVEDADGKPSEGTIYNYAPQSIVYPPA